MTNDAKLGLAVGFGLVLTVAVVFFRQDSLTTAPASDERTTIAVPAAPPRAPVRLSHGQTVPAKKVSRGEEAAPQVPGTLPDTLVQEEDGR